MYRKLCFLSSFILVFALSGAVQAIEIDVNNHSFEWRADGNQVTCHMGLGTTSQEGVLGWECDWLPTANAGWAGADVNCGVEGMCSGGDNTCKSWHIFPDGNSVCYIDNGIWVYQILDHNILAGKRYDLVFDSMIVEGVSYDTARAHFYYLQDPCIPDANHIDLAVQDFTVVGYPGPGGKTDWMYDLKLSFVAQASQPYDDALLGIRLTSPAAGGWIWLDDARVYSQWASQAYNPSPQDTAMEVPKDANLTWSPGLWAKSVNGHDVYFGSTWGEVNSATTGSNEFQINQSPNDWDAGTMVLGDTYYWRIDEVCEPGAGPLDPPGANGKWKGEIWSFTVTGRAKNPDPVDGDDDVAKNVILRWTRGLESLYHNVYFGTTEAIVENATTSSGEYVTQLNKGTEVYDAGTNENPQVAEQYFWRIDEVNSITVKGHTWGFTVADYILVDDFDWYANHAAQRAVWHDWLSGHTGNAEVWVNNDANWVVDGNSMRFYYWNTTGPYYSEAMRTYSSGQDWSYAGNGITALEIDFFGDVNSVPDPPMYVKLSDGSTTVQVNPGPNDVTSETVQTWFIPLSDFSGVTLSNITAITLGIGDNKGEGGKPLENGTLYFDDIRLRPPGCYPEYSKPAADFTRDCRVDVNDLMIVVNDWCRKGSWGLPAPFIEYLFEEGSGGTVANTGTWGNSYDLTIGLDETGAPEVSNDPCWYSDADPCRGWTMWFDGEVGLHASVDANGGDYLIIPPLNLNSNTVTITAWMKPDGPQNDGFTGLVHHTKDAGDEGCAGLSYAAGGGFVYDGTIGYVWNDNDSKSWGFEAGIYIPEQEWSMTALVLEPTQATMYIYDTNGTSDPCDDVLLSATNTLAHNLEEFDGDTYIAADSRGQGGRFYSGQMDAVRIYGFALSQAQLEDVIDDVPLTGDMYYPLASDADLCVGIKDPCDPCSPIDDQINFCDWSKFADEWLESDLWPMP